MASHERQTIRESVAAAIVDAATSVGSRVFETRIIPIRKAQLPCATVYSLSETSDDEGTGPRTLKRTLNLAVEGYVEDSDDVDDAMDDLALELERVMHADPTLDDECSDCVLTGTELDTGVLGEKPVGCVRLTYRVTYYTDAPRAADVTGLVDLETVHAVVDLAGEQAAADRSSMTTDGLEV